MERRGHRRPGSGVPIDRGQFEAVELAELCLLTESWDNTVWLVDQWWVLRFPRREAVIPRREREMALLPQLAPLVPLRHARRLRPPPRNGWPGA
jgi:hypothetical protein